MTSLLGSIFGSKEGEKANQNLFEGSETLPDRPQHKAFQSRQKNKRENEGPSVDESAKTETRKKKKRKSKTPEENKPTEDAPTNDTKKSEGAEKDEPKKDDVEERTIFVGNLPLNTKRKELRALFKECGQVESSRLRSVPVTGVKLPQDQAGNQKMMKKVCANTNQIDSSLTDTVIGYVVFKNVGDVPKALELNNTLQFKGMKIRVDRATPTVDPSRSVFVGNLPYGANETTLQEHFEKGCLLEPGDVLGVRIVRNKETFQCKGFGYVLFKEKNSVPSALKLHDSTYMKKKIRVMVCGKRFKGRKGEPAQPKTPSQPEKVSVGAFRRIIAKQQKNALTTNKRKRSVKKKNASVVKAGAGNVSKRVALDKKVEKKVKKLQKRAAKGMGKNKR